jgi:hypothetical protein
MDRCGVGAQPLEVPATLLACVEEPIEWGAVAAVQESVLADSVANRTSDIILLSDHHIGRQNLATGASAIIP